VKLVLDTCAILWLAENSSKLSQAARTAIAANPSEVYVSAISAFEIALKQRKGKLKLVWESSEWWPWVLERRGLIVLPVTDQIAIDSANLPDLHADPCDRIILATAIANDAAIVTSDAKIAQYKLAPIIW
jgi:PIN domain nuclease of toxin-antitoxin system